MRIDPLKTPLINIGDPLENILDCHVPTLKEGTIFAITSKIISICQERVIPKSSGITKESLIRQECEAILPIENMPGKFMTITHGLILLSAGIDESNANENYILYPSAVQATSQHIWHYLKQRDSLERLGVIITDSRTSPLRKGVTGFTLGWCGFKPLNDYRGKPDIYGRLLEVSQTNVIDSLASSAVFVMGEGDEKTPMALITDAPHVEFQTDPPTAEELTNIRVSIKEDLYHSLTNSDKWEWVR